MSASRHHRDVLTASLLFIGFIGWIAGMVNALPAPGPVGQGAAVFAAAVFAAVVGRRTVPDLGIGQVAIAAAVTVTLVLGVIAELRDQTLEPALLLPIAVATIGSILGMCVPHRPGSRRSGWLILATGAVGFGVTFIAVGLSMLGGSDSAAPVVIAGACVGGITSTLLLEDARAGQAAVGQALVYGTSLGAQDSTVEILIGGLTIGLVAGGVGGWVGRLLRPRMLRRSLPVARVEER